MGLVNLSIYLLTTSETFRQETVLLGHFQGDYIEELFGHYRQRAGGNFYISVQQVLEAARIDHAKTLLEVPSFEIDRSGNDGHACEKWNIEITPPELLIIDELGTIAFTTVSRELQLTMVYIAGNGRSNSSGLING